MKVLNPLWKTLVEHHLGFALRLPYWQMVSIAEVHEDPYKAAEYILILIGIDHAQNNFK